MSSQHEKPSTTLKEWLGISLFLLVGVTAGIITVLRLMKDGQGPIPAILVGSMTGGVAAWFIFFIGTNVWDVCRTGKKKHAPRRGKVDCD